MLQKKLAKNVGHKLIFFYLLHIDLKQKLHALALKRG